MPGKYVSREERIEIKNGETHHYIKSEERELSDEEMRKMKEGFEGEVSKMFKDIGSMMKDFFGGVHGGRDRQRFQRRR